MTVKQITTLIERADNMEALSSNRRKKKPRQLPAEYRWANTLQPSELRLLAVIEAERLGIVRVQRGHAVPPPRPASMTTHTDVTEAREAAQRAAAEEDARVQDAQPLLQLSIDIDAGRGMLAALKGLAESRAVVGEINGTESKK